MKKKKRQNYLSVYVLHIVHEISYFVVSFVRFIWVSRYLRLELETAPPFYVVIRATRGSRRLQYKGRYLHFSDILRPWVLVRPRKSNPRPSALQSNALPTKLVLPRQDNGNERGCLSNKIFKYCLEIRLKTPPFFDPWREPGDVVFVAGFSLWSVFQRDRRISRIVLRGNATGELEQSRWRRRKRSK